jgi:hypothetical protein
MLEKTEPKVLIAIDASGSMWSPPNLLVGAANLLASVANQLEGSGVTSIDYAFWDNTCDIPREFTKDGDDSVAQNLANGQRPRLQDAGISTLRTSVGGGGTNIYSVVARLSRYDEDGDEMYSEDDIEKFNLKFADQYDLIIIYSDFDLSSHPIPQNDYEIYERFGELAPNKLCCICCSETGERMTPTEFKESVVLKWISYEQWKHDIDIYRCQQFGSNV